MLDERTYLFFQKYVCPLVRIVGMLSHVNDWEVLVKTKSDYKLNRNGIDRDLDFIYAEAFFTRN